jgi:ketosteroid isomerase-like protein
MVRQPIAIKRRHRRRLDQRLFLAFPRLADILLRAVLRRRPSSWLRKAMLRRSVQLAVEASDRGDFEAAFALVPPDYEVHPPPELVGLGLDPVGRGREGRIRIQRQFQAIWGELRNEPEEIIDLGYQVLLVGRVRGTGATSGAAFDSETAFLFEVSEGRLMREQIFMTNAEALEAVGLREEDLKPAEQEN